MHLEQEWAKWRILCSSCKSNGEKKNYGRSSQTKINKILNNGIRVKWKARAFQKCIWTIWFLDAMNSHLFFIHFSMGYLSRKKGIKFQQIYFNGYMKKKMLKLRNRRFLKRIFNWHYGKVYINIKRWKCYAQRANVQRLNAIQ